MYIYIYIERERVYIYIYTHTKSQTCLCAAACHGEWTSSNLVSNSKTYTATTSVPSLRDCLCSRMY